MVSRIVSTARPRQLGLRKRAAREREREREREARFSALGRYNRIGFIPKTKISAARESRLAHDASTLRRPLTPLYAVTYKKEEKYNALIRL